MKVTNKWFPFGYEKESDKPMVFCFHCAGGNSAFYREWSKNLVVNFVPVELPGRGRRISEPCSEDMEKLIEELVIPILIASEGKNYYFYGHSMGALIAFATAHKIEEKYHSSPQKLIVAGRTAPNYSDNARFKSYMDNTALLKELRRLKGTPEEILNNDEIMDFMIPVIRNDYMLLESYHYNGQILDIPIVAHAGSNDEDASLEEMEHWKEVTSKSCITQEFNGNHFFVQTLGDYYMQAVVNTIFESV